MRVARITRNDMPVHMWRHIAEAREIHLVRAEHRAHSLFNREHHAHAMRALRGRQVGHFFHVRVPDDATEAGVIGIGHDYHTAVFVAPEQIAAAAFAQRTGDLRIGPGIAGNRDFLDRKSVV